MERLDLRAKDRHLPIWQARRPQSSHHRAQHGFERRQKTPRQRGLSLPGIGGTLGHLHCKSVLARPGSLKMGIVKMKFFGLVTMRAKAARIEIGKAKEAVVPGRQLFRIGLAFK